MCPEPLSITETLAQYAAGSSFDDFPAGVIDKAKQCIKDAVACAYGGAQTVTGRIVDEVTVRAFGGEPEAAVLGTGRRVSRVAAAFANSKVANALDFDDTYYGHPGACIVHPALAVAQHDGVTGRELLRAVIAGYEVSCRIGAAIQPSRERFRSIWGIAPWNTFGAAVAVGCLIGLDGGRMAHAMGIAGSNAPVASTYKTVMNPRRVTMAKESFAIAGQLGVVSALLAREGFVGPVDILDGDTGFWVMFGSDRCDFERMTRNLGEEHEILNVALKPYSTCRWIHTAIDAGRKVMAGRGLRLEDVEKITIDTSPLMGVLPYTRRHPDNMEDAQFSLPFSMALGLSDIPPGPEWFRPSVFTDPLLNRISSAVEIRTGLENEADPFYVMAEVEIVDRAGRAFSDRVDVAWGDPGNPMTGADTERKFERLVEPVLGRDRTLELGRALSDLERLQDTRELGPLL